MCWPRGWFSRRERRRDWTGIELSGGEGADEVRATGREVVGARAAEEEALSGWAWAWALDGGGCEEDGGRLLMARAEAVLGSPGYGE